MARRYPRPPPQYSGAFMNLLALPEIAGRTLGELGRGRQAVRIWCRACGRDVVIPPHGFAQLFPDRLETRIEAFVSALRCETCGAREAQASGHSLEIYDPRPMFVRREHAGVTLRQQG